MSICLEAKTLSVGYRGKALIEEISFGVKHGEIVTLIGPNGSGKSTILKTLTGHLASIAGVVYIDQESLKEIPHKKLATKVSVVLTERITPELMTCREVVASGRYPYTNRFGRLTHEDNRIVEEALEKVHGLPLAERDFNAISDGQRQRIMLARALAQQPEVIVLDEPTSFLDIKHKIELLDILRQMSREKGIGVVMSLHEIDLAPKISDRVICVKGDRISRVGLPEEIFQEEIINELYDIQKGSYNMLFGSVELTKPQGASGIFVLGGNGKGTPIYRQLQKQGIPFDTGILFENDVDAQVASCLANQVFITHAFEPIQPEIIAQAKKSILNCKGLLCSGVAFRGLAEPLAELVTFAHGQGIPVYNQLEEAKLDETKQ